MTTNDMQISVYYYFIFIMIVVEWYLKKNMTWTDRSGEPLTGLQLKKSNLLYYTEKTVHKKLNKIHKNTVTT